MARFIKSSRQNESIKHDVKKKREGGRKVKVTVEGSNGIE